MDDLIDDANVHEMRVGATGVVQGRIEGVLFGEKYTGLSTTPALTVSFVDWGSLYITIRDYKTAKSIPKGWVGQNVRVNVQCISEDGEVMALAMVRSSDRAHMLLGEPMTTVSAP